MIVPTADRRLAAGIVGSLTLLIIGWTGLLVPSLIRSIEDAFDQNDAGIGVAYLAYAIAYGAGSILGGQVIEGVGRRPILAGAAVLHGVGIAGLGLAPSWPLFVAAMLPAGIGAGCLDGGSNGLVLDVYREGRGRAMNLLHISFSVGALLAPLVIGRAVEAGTAWNTVMLVSAVPLAGLAVAYLIVPMPTGRRIGVAATGGLAAAGSLFSGPLLLLGVAIASYVAAEIGVSNWLVRFLEPAPIATATLALSLLWTGATVGRLLSAAIADRFDHLRFTIVCIVLMGLAIGAAVAAAPALPLSMALFALSGVASGPVFPMIIALGGERFPDRSAAVGGALVGCAVVGSTIYPPAIGFLSVTVGLPIAMAGNALLCLLGAAALVAFGTAKAPASEARVGNR